MKDWVENPSYQIISSILEEQISKESTLSKYNTIKKNTAIESILKFISYKNTDEKFKIIYGIIHSEQISTPNKKLLSNRFLKWCGLGTNEVRK